MYTFKQFLEESRSAPLYHGTHPELAERVLLQDKFKAITEHRAEDRTLSGISTSRSFDSAKRFGPIVFELDQIKLSHNHRIIPIQWFNSQNTITQKMVGARSRRETTARGFRISNNVTEFEEFVVGQINNARSYIKAIYIRSSVRDAHTIQDLAAKYGIPTHYLLPASRGRPRV